MKKRQTWQYICEFCNKRGLSAAVIARHEKSCTKNPRRVCRVCAMDHNGLIRGEGRQADIAQLMALLPDPAPHHTATEEGFPYFADSLTVECNRALVALRKAAGNCPACIMSAIRQKGIPVPMVTDFDFTQEMKWIWAEVNEAQAAKSECYR